MKYILMSVLGLLLCMGTAAQSAPQPPPAAGTSPAIVCLGNLSDSIASELIYGQYPSADVDTGSDSAEQIARSVRDGSLGDLTPKIIVLTLCAEDAGLANRTPWSCAREIGDLIYVLRAKKPKAKIVLMSMFPCHAGGLNTTVSKTNRLLRTLADGRDVIFADVSPTLTLADGKSPDPTLLNPEATHLTAEGCRRIAAVLRPTLERLLQ